MTNDAYFDAIYQKWEQVLETSIKAILSTV